jgi:hypothetical protein
MPRIGLTVNQWYTEISSSDPETLGRWFAEQLLRFPELAVPSTLVRLRIDPLWSPATPQHPQGVPDWNTDSRFSYSQSIRCGGTTEESMKAILEEMTRMAYPEGEDIR